MCIAAVCKVENSMNATDEMLRLQSARPHKELKSEYLIISKVALSMAIKGPEQGQCIS